MTSSFPGQPLTSRPNGNPVDQAGQFEISNAIGKGAYATVYKAKDKKNKGQFVALKEILIPINSEDGVPMSAIREIGLLKQLEKFYHQNIVKLLDVCLGPRTYREMKLMLVFEHIDQDLGRYLEKIPSPGLGPDRIADLMFQIMSGIDFIHMHRILHRDLKPQNILVTSSGRVKIADFGLARVYAFQMALTSIVVTLFYRAPEVILHDHYCAAVDIWSCGCILAELHTRKPLFPGSSDVDQLAKIFECIGVPSEQEWPEQITLPRSSFRQTITKSLENLVPNAEPAALDLMKKMLTFDQNSRISAQDSLKHKLFEDVHSDDERSSQSSSGSSAMDDVNSEEIESTPVSKKMMNGVIQNFIRERSRT